MSTLLSSARSTKPIRRPVVASLVLTINGTPYDVEPIGNAPAGLRSFRLAKCSGDGATYDLDAFGDRVECSCPSYQKTHAGTTSLCKHGKSLVTVGLVDYPKAAEAPAVAPLPDGPSETKCDDVILCSLAPAVSPECDVVTLPVEPHARVVPVFDREPYRIANIVAKGDACWLIQRPRSTREPLPAAEPRDVVIIDEDGTPLETPREMDRRHRAEHAAAVAELMDGSNPFLPVARQVEQVPCCPAEETEPCAGCVTPLIPLPAAEPSEADWQDFGEWASEVDTRAWEARCEAEPDDADGEGWTDDDVITLGPDAEPIADGPEQDRRTLAETIDGEARHYRTLGTAFGDLMAETIERLAAEVRWLDASTPDAYMDRREAALDAARDAAEARLSSARCC